MGLLSHSFITVLSVLGSAPLAFGRSVPGKNVFAPRGATEGFQCEYPAGWQFCNDVGKRDCWVISREGKVFNISTDYETQIPEGKTRTFDLVLSEKAISPDGVSKTASLINGKYPGELIEACWGDTIIVNVKNELPHNGTTIHWHGLRQLNTNHMDGVNGITQCPTSQGETTQYKFRVTQYGHTWYHSHYSSQYTEGVAAPLLIHGPHSSDWEIEFPPMIVTDWLHNSAYDEFKKEINGSRTLPTMDSILVDGLGKFKGIGSLYNQTFEAGKKYLIRIINGSTGFHFHFSLDDHIMTVVSMDFVPIKPYNTTSLSVGIGQRYGVIIEAKPTKKSKNGKYWMRTEYTTSGGCNAEIVGNPSKDPDSQRTGFIQYTDATEGDPSTERQTAIPIGCSDEKMSNLVPIVPWSVTVPQNDINGNTYEAGLDLTNKDKWHNAVNRWSITDTPMWLDMSSPTLLNLANETWNPEYAVVKYDYNPDKGFVYLVISSGKIVGSVNPLSKVALPHPIHLHGHDFAIIGQGTTKYDPNKTPATFVLDNPPRRDVAMLPSGGYLAIAFKPDNPGAWIVHCHIAWHAGSGLALQILERKSELVSKIGADSISTIQDGCSKWKSWVSKNPIHQEDSGI